MTKHKIFHPFTLPNGTKISNRIVMAPMTTWGSNDDNTVSEEEIAFYTARAENLGMLITGCTHVSYNGIGFENEFSAYDDKFLPGLSKLAQAIKEKNTKAILQINHAGNKALQHLIKDAVVSASNIETLDTEFASSCPTRALTEEEIFAIIEDFAKTTERAIKSGFDGIEIHAAHGFLIQNFMSPYFNKRDDIWGGSLENRMRFPLEIVKKCKDTISNLKPNFILGYRLSPYEDLLDGLTLEDNYILIDNLVNIGVDYLHISLQNTIKEKPKQEGHTYLELINTYVNNRIPLMVAGNIKDIETINKTLENCDFVAIGHALLTEPKFLEKIKNGTKDIELSLDFNKLTELSLPKKLVSEIIKNEGWFKIKNFKEL